MATNPATDAYKFLKLSPNPDGSVTRLASPPTSPACPDPISPDSVRSKDVPLDPAKGTFIRIFLPPGTPSDAKLPIIVYFHGGGFVLFSATSTMFHDSCSRMAHTVPALVLSVEYRLAPEHRLPAAYEDAVDALHWLRKQATAGGDEWVKEHGDFSRCFLMGSSAGGNITYYTGLCALEMDLCPIQIKGLIMNQTFFGGIEWTDSELRLANDRIISQPASELLWSLALPEGADRGHKYCHPFTPGLAEHEKVKRLPRCLVRGYTGDPLSDRQKQLAKMLSNLGAEVVSEFNEGGFHGIELFDPVQAQSLMELIKAFVNGGDGVIKSTM
ncbi:hypothetical protein MLD38_016557 [Melastoma candidum]|uniref:Uncharacterized protein n=1 Tax=Melastoma candidum TaxID=119954 RepID=A0ACB9QMX9_9MYRT|nr:hypothetical protein MLD38_016557 [Melastoma candidum]